MSLMNWLVMDNNDKSLLTDNGPNYYHQLLTMVHGKGYQATVTGIMIRTAGAIYFHDLQYLLDVTMWRFYVSSTRSMCSNSVVTFWFTTQPGKPATCPLRPAISDCWRIYLAQIMCFFPDQSTLAYLSSAPLVWANTRKNIE